MKIEKEYQRMKTAGGGEIFGEGEGDPSKKKGKEGGKDMNLIYVSKCHANSKNSSAPRFI